MYVEAENLDLCSLLPEGWKISHPKPRMNRQNSPCTRFVIDLSQYKEALKKKRKSIDMEKLPRSGPKMRFPPRRSTGIEPLPRPRLDFASGGLLPKEVILESAEIALSSFNLKSLSEQGPEYELIEALECVRFVTFHIVHCNFIARQKNECEAENELFFAEVKYSPDFIDKDGIGCSLCCILGPTHIVTGNHGCKSCQRYPDLIQHPPQGGFTIHPFTSEVDLGKF